MEDAGVFIIQLIVVVAMCVWAQSIMEKKGRKYGWLLGLLGLIGIIIAAVIPANAEVQLAQELGNGVSKRCPDCAEIIKKEAKVCKHCGYQFP